MSFMCRFSVTFVNEKGWRITVFCDNPNWFGIKEAGRAVLDKQEEHTKHGPWEYLSSTRVS